VCKLLFRVIGTCIMTDRLYLYLRGRNIDLIYIKINVYCCVVNTMNNAIYFNLLNQAYNIPLDIFLSFEKHGD
jgi:hypothetical protein